MVLKDRGVNGHDIVRIVDMRYNPIGEHQRLERVVSAVKSITEGGTLKSTNYNGGSIKIYMMRTAN